jgi:hypothetical protein
MIHGDNTNFDCETDDPNTRDSLYFVLWKKAAP